MHWLKNSPLVSCVGVLCPVLSNQVQKDLRHKMARGTFRDIFWFPIGKEISETIFLVDWQNQIFPEFFFSKIFLWSLKGILHLKKPGNFMKFFFAILITLKNQPEKWPHLFF